MLINGAFDKKSYASSIHEVTWEAPVPDLKVTNPSVLEVFQTSNTHEKFGSITNTVGKSVSFVLISSICLVAQSIKKLGNDDILLCCICKTSSNSPL